MRSSVCRQCYPLDGSSIMPEMNFTSLITLMKEAQCTLGPLVSHSIEMVKRFSNLCNTPGSTTMILISPFEVAEYWTEPSRIIQFSKQSLRTPHKESDPSKCKIELSTVKTNL